MARKKTRKQSPALPSGWIALGLFLVAAALYVNTLGHGFVFDDHTLILQNLTVTQTNWFGILFGGEYRPIRTLTYAFNFAIGGDAPFGYHLFNLLLHGGVVLALFALIRLLTGSERVAAIAALLFAAHPVQTAAVAYISGRKDVLATFFLVAGLALIASGRRFILALVCFALAVLSKEVAAVFPLLILLVLVARDLERQGGDRSLSDLSAAFRSMSFLHLRLLAGATGLATVLVVWVVFLRGASRMEGLWGGSWATNLGTSCKLFAHYVKLALTGHPLIGDYSGKVFPISAGITEPATLASVVLIAAFVGLAGWLLIRLPWAGVGLFWFLICLLPVLHLIPFHELAADHFLYLPLAGIALAAAVGLDRLASRQRVVIWGTVGVIAVAGAIRTVQRNGDWKDDDTFWQATLRDAPDSYRANQGVGLTLNAQRRWLEAIVVAERAAALNPNDQAAWSNLGQYQHEHGTTIANQGRLDEGIAWNQKALQSLDRAVAIDPDNFVSRNTRGSIHREFGRMYERQGRLQDALDARVLAAEDFLQGLASTEPRVEIQVIWINLAGIFQDMGDFAEARHYLDHYLRAFPNDPRGNFNMGEAYFKTGDYVEAIPFLERGLAVQSDSIEGWDYLAKSYLGAGRAEDALGAYRRALPHSAQPAEIYLNMGTIYAGLGDRQQAIRHLEQALQANPNGPLVGRILRELNEVRSPEVERPG